MSDLSRNLYNALVYERELDIKKILEIPGFDVNQVCFQNERPIIHAIGFRYLQGIKLLIAAKCDLTAVGGYQRTPLLYACERGYDDVVEILVEAGAPLDDANTESIKPLHSAVQRGHFNIMQCLVEAGADINAVVEYMGTPLSLALCSKDTIQIASYLIHKGADLYKYPKGYREMNLQPLFSTIKYGNLEGLKLLIAAGIDVTRYYLRGRHPVIYAMRKEQYDMVVYLLNFIKIECDFEEYKYNDFYDPVNNGRTKYVELFLARGFDVNALCHYTCTPLAVAVNNGDTKMIKTLLAYGANPHIPNKEGITPYDIILQNPRTRGHLRPLFENFPLPLQTLSAAQLRISTLKIKLANAAANIL